MDMTFGHWSSDAASYFVNNLSSFLKSEGNTSHHAEICQVRFFGNHLVDAKLMFYVFQTVFGIFLIDSSKEISFCNSFLKCLFVKTQNWFFAK